MPVANPIDMDRENIGHLVNNHNFVRMLRQGISRLGIGRSAASGTTSVAGVARSIPGPARLLLGLIPGACRLVAAPAVLALGIGLASLGEFGQQDKARPPAFADPSPERLRVALDRAFQAANSTQDAGQKVEDLLIVARAQIRFGRKADALLTLQDALKAVESIDPDAEWSEGPIGFGSPARTIRHPILRIAEAQAQAGDRDAAHATYRRALALIARMRDMNATYTWMELLPSQIEVDRPEGVRASLDAYRASMPDPGGPHRGMADIATMRLVAWRAAAGDVDGALAEYRRTRGFHEWSGGNVGLQAFLGILGSLRPGERPEDRSRVGPLVAEARRLIDEAPPTFSDRSRLLLKLAGIEAKVGRVDAAIADLDAIEPDARDEPDRTHLKDEVAEAYLDVAALRSRAGRLADAAALARKAARLLETTYAVRPVIRAAEILAGNGDVPGALKVAAMLSPARRPIREIAETQDTSGDPEGARATLAGLLREAEAEGEPWSIAELQARLGDIPAALRTLGTLKGEARDSAMTSLATTRARLGDLDAALGLVDRVDDPARRGKALLSTFASLPAPESAKGGGLIGPDRR